MPVCFVNIGGAQKQATIKPNGSEVKIVSVSLAQKTNEMVVVKYSDANGSGVIASLSTASPQSTAFSTNSLNQVFNLAVESEVAISIALESSKVPTITYDAFVTSEDDEEEVAAPPAKKAKVAEKPVEKKVEKVEKTKAVEKVEKTKAVEKVEKTKAVEKKEVKKEETEEATGSVVTLAGGLQIKDLEVGNGGVVARGKKISLRYQGMLSSGKVFDTNMPRGAPLQFVVGSGEVIKGMDNGVVGMKRGGKRRLVIPPSLGYGVGGAPPTIPGNATLIFDVEIVKC